MVRSLASCFVLLVSSSALACPNLAGTFSCPDGQGGFQKTVSTQTETGGVWTFEIKKYDQNGNVVQDQTEVADGVAHMTPDPTSGQTVPTTFTCEGDIALKAEATFTNPQVGQIQVSGLESLDTSGNIVSDITVTMSAGPYHTQQVCTRQQN